MSSETIFWCGAVLNHQGLEKYKGEAPSASQWSRSLLNALCENGTNVVGFAPIWDALFPKGHLFPNNKSYLDSGINQKSIQYVNFPFIRTKSVSYSLEKNINKELQKGSTPIAILNYNPYTHYSNALRSISAKYPNIPWINVVLDLDDPTSDNWSNFLRITEKSSGSIFLSWWGFENAPIDNKMHLDSGWDGNYPETNTNPDKVFLYAGKMSDYGGINDIIEAIKIFPRSDVEFHFYGKGQNEKLNKLVDTDRRVRFFGFVTDEVLNNACCNATAFLSPRDLNFQGTRMIFPSKLLFYLRYKKPVISPMLPGLAPAYHDIIIRPVGNTPLDWTNSMDNILTMSQVEINNLSTKIRLYLDDKVWHKQIPRLMEFLKAIHKKVN